MEGIIVGVFILIVIGGVFWLVFPAFMSRYKRDEQKRNPSDFDDKS